MPAARRFPGLELSFPLLARLRRRLYTVSGGLGPVSSSGPQHFAEGQGRARERLRDPFGEGLPGGPGPAASPLWCGKSVPGKRARSAESHTCPTQVCGWGLRGGPGPGDSCSRAPCFTKGLGLEGQVGARRGRVQGQDRDPACCLLPGIPVSSASPHRAPAARPCCLGLRSRGESVQLSGEIC